MSDTSPEPVVREFWKCPRCGFTRINLTECQCEINPAKLLMALRGQLLLDRDSVITVETKEGDHHELPQS